MEKTRVKDKQVVQRFVDAIEKGDSERVKAFIESGMDINVEYAPDKTPLMLAVKSGDFAIAQMLLDNGAEIGNQNDRVPLVDSVLLYAIDSENKEHFKLLVENKGDVNARNKKGETPLMLAVKEHDFKFIKVLLDNKVDIKIQDNNHNTAFDYAKNITAFKEHPEILDRINPEKNKQVSKTEATKITESKKTSSKMSL